MAYHPEKIHNGLAIYYIGTTEKITNDNNDNHRTLPILFMPGPHRFQIPGDGSAKSLIDGLVRHCCCRCDNDAPRALRRAVISFDPPGSGHSMKRPVHLSMEEMHQCADETLDVFLGGGGDLSPSSSWKKSEGSGIVDAVGHSMGGLCLLSYVLKNPTRIRRMVLIGAGCGGQSYMKARGALWNSTHPSFCTMTFLGLLQFVWPCQALQTIMMNFIYYHSLVNKERWYVAQKVHWRDWFRRREKYPEWHQVARKLDYRDELREIQVPTLLLCGRHDPQYPPCCTQELAENIPKSHAVYFEQSGHYPFIEEADEFWSVVSDFLK